MFTFIRPTFVRPQFAVALVRPQLVLLLLRWSHPSDAASTTARTLQENVEDSKPIIVLEDVKVTLNGCKEVNVMLFQMQDVEAYTTVIKKIVKWQGMDRGHGYILYSTCYIMNRFIFPNKHMLLSTWKQLRCTLPLHIAQGKTDTGFGMWMSCKHRQQRS